MLVQPIIIAPQKKIRITEIKLTNCRAYLGQYDPIRLSGGQNLIIYGENGSGKSSLFKAIGNYFSSSLDSSILFVKNKYFEGDPGSIELTFSSFDAVSNNNTNEPDKKMKFGSDFSDNNANFVKSASLIKGFLDYSNLLDVYLHKESRPNLFGLVVLNLLGDQYAVRSGGDFRFKQKWNDLQRNLIDESRTRRSKRHKLSLIELRQYHTHLDSTLTSVFTELNRLLSTYFQDLQVSLSYEFPEFIFQYGAKWQWNTVASLKLKVFKDGFDISNDYRDTLNEARLSAFAICLYLASLKENPDLELKLIYLDDVFIGLDSGNRIPILDILINEFEDYQIIISTYDRHWFELAKRRFNALSRNKWLPIEFYVGNYEYNNNLISRPIIVVGEENYDRAIKYLHDRSKPDYPAAANYFRKTLEELIVSFMPKWEIADTENTQIPDYQLTSLCNRTFLFLDRIGQDPKHISNIISLLPALLHPLSHHEISAQVYKNELSLVERSISLLKEQLIVLDIPTNYKCALEASKRLKITFAIDIVSNHYSFYEIILKEPLTLKRQTNNAFTLCKCLCYADKIYGHNGTISYPAFNPNKKDLSFNYNSLHDACEKIYTYLIGQNRIGYFPKTNNYLDLIMYHDGTIWKAINELVV
ncbi:ATP-binding protein [Spirosoma spitsbergense]|uniref:ATP-binding protein n=1 Tax=Spirosoma spitsbergense TaxID=431554 RepID=UPI00037788F7|nr:ATP-binding protein [Spirosoma spitsbergense]